MSKRQTTQGESDGRCVGRMSGARGVCAVAALLLIAAPALGQTLSQGPRSPGAAFDDATFGTPIWNNPNNAQADDGSYATVSPGGTNTHYLHANNYNFTIPGPAQVQGIEVNIKRKSAAGTIKDARVRIVKNGVISSTDRSNPNTWSTTETTVTYGSPTDLWGETWTAADINATSFGVVLSVTDSIDTAAVNYISITVYYALCNTAPAVGCRTAGKSVLVVKNNTDNTKDKLIWKWVKGAATTLADFADPTVTANYGLCLYANNALVATAGVSPGSNWTPLSSGYKYKDLSGTPNGIQKVRLKVGAATKAKVIVKGKGTNLPDPAMPFATPLKVQFVNGDTGVCWESNFATPLKNASTFFKGRTP